MKKGIMYPLLSAFLYGFAPVLCSFSYQLGNNPYTMTFLRSLFVIPVLQLLSREKKIGYGLPVQKLPDLLTAGLFSVMTTLLLYRSYLYLGVGTAVSIHFMYPLLVMLICRFVWHETVSPTQKRSVLSATAGLLLFVRFRDLINMKGILCAFLSALCYALYLVWIEKRKLGDLNDYKLSYYLAVIACAFLLVFNLYSHELVWVQPGLSYLFVFLTAVCTSFLAVIFLKKGIREIGSSNTSLLCLAEPVAALVFGGLFLHEEVTMNKIAGCICIIGAILSAFFRKDGKNETN